MGQVGRRDRGHFSQQGMGAVQHVAIVQAVGQLQREHVGQLPDLLLQPIDQGLDLLRR